MIFVTGVASGALLKLKVLFSCSSAYCQLLSLDIGRRFRVRVARDRNLHQRCIGNYACAEQSTAYT